MNIKGGYYIKSRCISESWIANSSPVIRETWDYLLREANHADKKYNSYTIKRGQLFRTYQDIIEALHWKVGFRKHYYTKDAMKHAMKALTKALMITPTKTPRGVIITICNYDRYQNPKNYEHPNEDPTNTPRTPQQRPTINKNVKNLKNEKKENINRGEREKQFNDLFWPVYPPRNGKRRDKKLALDQFIKLQSNEIPLVLTGVRHYQQSSEVKRGYAKDAFRWLRNKSYMAWQTPEEATETGEGMSEEDFDKMAQL